MFTRAVKLKENHLTTEENQAGIAILDLIPSSWSQFKATLSVSSHINTPISIQLTIKETDSDASSLAIKDLNLFHTNSFLGLIYMKSCELSDYSAPQYAFSIEFSGLLTLDKHWSLSVNGQDTYVIEREAISVKIAEYESFFGETFEESDAINFQLYIDEHVDENEISEHFIFIYHKIKGYKHTLQMDVDEWLSSLNDGFTMLKEVKAFLDVWLTYIEWRIEHKRALLAHEGKVASYLDNHSQEDGFIINILKGDTQTKLKAWLLNNPDTAKCTCYQDLMRFIQENTQLDPTPYRTLLSLQHDLSLSH